MLFKYISCACLVLFFNLPAQAVIVNGYGTFAISGSASNCPSFCTTAGGGQFTSSSDGGEFKTSAYATDNTFGFGEAMAELSGPLGLPTLKAQASSDVGKQGRGSTFASQGYTFTGQSSEAITLDLNLTGTITNNPIGYVFNRITASIAVIRRDSIPFFTDFSGLVFELVPSSDVVAVADLIIDDEMTTSDSADITFTVNPGEDYYVVATLTAVAQNGIADAFSTLNLNLLDDSGNTLDDSFGFQAATVPVPAAVWLSLSALLSLTSFRKQAT